MLDRRMRSGTELAREIQLTDWSTAGNLSNRSAGVQIPRDICTRFGPYLYSTKCSWIIKYSNHFQVLPFYKFFVEWQPESERNVMQKIRYGTNDGKWEIIVGCSCYESLLLLDLTIQMCENRTTE